MKIFFVSAMMIMGFSGLVAEIVLLRELLTVFSGNELSIGIVLSNWLLLEAAGCFFPGRLIEKTRGKLELFTLFSILFVLFLPIAVLLARNLKNMLGVSLGESIGLLPMFYCSLLILLPVTTLHGALFTCCCRIYATLDKREAASVGNVYIYETVGTVVGGILCTFLWLRQVNSFQVVWGVGMANLAVCFALFAVRDGIAVVRKTGLAVTAVLCVLFLYAGVSGVANGLHEYAIRLQWRNHNVVHYQNSPYGNICVVENQGQHIFFQDGVATLITPIPDIVHAEEFVHLPLLFHPEPANVMILSGGVGGVISEVLKHPTVVNLEYAELDPLFLELTRKFATSFTEAELNDARIRISLLDGQMLLKTTPDRYDLIFVGVAEPVNLQTNRYFTREFFAAAKTKLDPGGIVVAGLPGSLSFSCDELKKLNSSIHHTLDQVFSHVRVIPGEGKNIFLASDTADISGTELEQVLGRLAERNMETCRMVPWHIENKLHPGWTEWFDQFIQDSGENINRNLRPVGLFYSISRWNSLHAPVFGAFYSRLEGLKLSHVAIGVAACLAVCLLAFSRRGISLRTGVPVAIASTGFAGMMFSLIVIFSFQAMYGHVFSWAGLLIASFMTGSACGALLATSSLHRIRDHVKLLKRSELLIIGFCGLLPLIFLADNVYLYDRDMFLFLRALFPAVSFFCGLLPGAQFPLANSIYLKEHTNLSGGAGLLYASDLLGGWLGGIVGAVVLLPVLGLVGTCIAVALVKLASLTVLSRATRT